MPDPQIRVDELEDEGSIRIMVRNSRFDYYHARMAEYRAARDPGPINVVGDAISKEREEPVRRADWYTQARNFILNMLRAQTNQRRAERASEEEMVWAACAGYRRASCRGCGGCAGVCC
jgi:hypothetical protein